MANEAVCRRSEQASYLTVAILNESGGHEILMPPPDPKAIWHDGGQIGRCDQDRETKA